MRSGMKKYLKEWGKEKKVQINRIKYANSANEKLNGK